MSIELQVMMEWMNIVMCRCDRRSIQGHMESCWRHGWGLCKGKVVNLAIMDLHIVVLRRNVFFFLCVEHLFALVDECCTWIVWTHYFESSVQLKKLPLVPGDFWQILCAFSLIILCVFSLFSVINFLMIKNRCLSPHLSIPSWYGNSFCGDKKLHKCIYFKTLYISNSIHGASWFITNEETATGSCACNFN